MLEARTSCIGLILEHENAIAAPILEFLDRHATVCA